MSKEAAIKLLFMKAARQPTPKEIKDLIECPIPEGSKVANILHMRGPIQRLMQNSGERPSLLNHPFIELLGGHPQAISLIGSMLKDKELKTLFLRF